MLLPVAQRCNRMASEPTKLLTLNSKALCRGVAAPQLQLFVMRQRVRWTATNSVVTASKARHEAACIALTDGV